MNILPLTRRATQLAVSIKLQLPFVYVCTLGMEVGNSGKEGGHERVHNNSERERRRETGK